MKRTAWLLTALALVLLPADGSGALLDGVGAMGDSLTDEYEFSGLGAGRNWLEQLARSRGLNFGALSTTARAEPRRAGYEYNWARSGATSATLLSGGQHTGLADQVAQGKVTLAYLGIGANDFGSSYSSIYDGTLAGASLDAFVANIADNVKTALDTVSARGAVKLVIGNIPDYGVAPTLIFLFPDAAKRKRVTDATDAVNTRIAALAAARGIPVVDLFAFGRTILLDERRLVVGGVEINLTAGDDPRNLLLYDGIHPGSVAHGLIANTFLEAIRVAYGSSVAARSDQEILRDAGITPPAGADTYYDVKRFVKSAAISRLLLTQVAVGGGYATAFTVVNTGGSASSGTLSLFDTAGQPLQVTLSGGSSQLEGSSFDVSVPAGGVRIYNAARSGATAARTGWARIDSSGGTLGAVSTFQFASGGALRMLAGVLGSQTTAVATIPVDNDDGSERFTGFAVANPEDEGIAIRLVTLGEDGAVLDNVLPDRLKLGARAQAALFLHELVPARLKFRGSMVLVGQSGKKFSVVALVQVQGQLTAIPVVPEKSPGVPN